MSCLGRGDSPDKSWGRGWGGWGKGWCVRDVCTYSTRCNNIMNTIHGPLGRFEAWALSHSAAWGISSIITGKEKP